MKVPSTPGYERSSSACQATPYGTSTSFAPNARMRSSFAAGAGSIARTVHGPPAGLAPDPDTPAGVPALMVQIAGPRTAADKKGETFGGPRSVDVCSGL